jgi:hypothetical protein
MINLPDIPENKILQKELISEIIPLKYKALTNYSNIKNILLVHDQVKNYMDFVNNCNDNTFPIIYNNTSSGDELKAFLTTNFTSVDRLCIVFDELHIWSTKIFMDNKPFFTDGDLTESDINNLSANIKLIINLCNQLNIKNVDYLACFTLKYDKWINYYKQLNTLTVVELNNSGVIVGASDDKTGNIKHGGDWVLESTGQNVESIYFTDGISDYASTLDGVTSITATGGSTIYIKQDVSDSNLFYSFNDISWVSIPLTDKILITNITASPTVALNVLFTTDITFGIDSTNNTYFICGSEYITFNGGNHTVTIDGVSGYPGLIQNGISSSPGYSNITVSNINLTADNSSTLSFVAGGSGGWICQAYFGNGVTNCIVSFCSSDAPIKTSNYGGGGILGDSSTALVDNCYSLGIIYDVGGGIFGLYAISCTATNCYSKGDMINVNSGGIYSYGCSVCIATNCYSTGQINNTNGGIFGPSCKSSLATNCYSTGVIGDYGGGIFGYYANSVNTGGTNTCSATNCYSTGVIGPYAGGIFGYRANNSNTGGTNTCSATNCYSVGTIGDEGGGIFGYLYNTCSAINCYTCGSYTSTSNGIFSGSSNDNPSPSSSNYSEANNSSSGWSDFNATFTNARPFGLKIIVIPITIWTSINTNTPFLLTAFNTNFYNGVISASVTSNQYTNLMLNSNPLTLDLSFTQYFQIIPLTSPVIINTSGQMTSSSPTIYTIQVLRGFVNSTLTFPVGVIIGYNIITFTLTVIKNNPIINNPITFNIKTRTCENKIKKIKLKGYSPTISKLKFYIKSEPSHGTVFIKRNNAYYEPNKDYIGKDSFKYYCKNDIGLKSNVLKVKITILANCTEKSNK